MDNLKDKLDDVTLSVGGGLVPALTDLADAVAGFDDAARKAGASGGLGDVLRAAWENSGGYDLIDGLGRIGNLLGDSGDEVEDFGGRMEYYASRVKAAAQETASSTRTEEEANEAREEADRLTKAITTAVDARRKAEQDLRNELLAAIDKNYAYRVAVDDAEEALSEYNEATKTGKLTTEELDDATRETGRQLYETAAAYAESKGAATGSQEAIDAMIESLYIQMSTLGPNSPLRLELLAYIEELGRIPTDIETKMRVTRFGDVGYERLARGGPVRKGVPVIVGDNPDGSLNSTSELFVPDSAGQILSASQTQSTLGSGTGMASGSAITVNIYPKALPTDRELIDLVNSVRRRNGNVI